MRLRLPRPRPQAVFGTLRRWLHASRDLWAFIAIGIAAIAIFQQNRTVGKLKRDGVALCAFRDDLRTRALSTQEFLNSHPDGIPGIPASTLRVSLQNEQHTLVSLKALVC